MLDVFKSHRRMLRIVIDQPRNFEEMTDYFGYWLPLHGGIHSKATSEEAAKLHALGANGGVYVQSIMVFDERSFEKLRKDPWPPESYLARIPDFTRSSLQIIEVEAEDPARRAAGGRTGLDIYLFLTTTAKATLRDTLERGNGTQDRLLILGFDALSAIVPQQRILSPEDDRKLLLRQSFPAPSIEVAEVSLSPWRESDLHRTVRVSRTSTLR